MRYNLKIFTIINNNKRVGGYTTNISGSYTIKKKYRVTAQGFKIIGC